jgi:molybdenum cofactor biosynthesis enzyme MoaA
MTVEETQLYLSEASGVSRLESFLVFGGEPMLYPEIAIAACRKANELGIPKIDMLTNGVWGRNKAQAEKLARKLKDAGLNILGISVDAFHLRFIPLDLPRNAAEASVKAGIERVTWNVAVVQSLDAQNKYDRTTRRILKSFSR